MNLIEVQKKVFPRIKEVLNKEPEIISSLEETSEGWVLQCDVLEKKAVPETFDLLKIFEFKLDKNAEIIGFKQIKKVRRGDMQAE